MYSPVFSHIEPMKTSSTIAAPVSVRFNETTKASIDRFAKLTRRSRSFIINEGMEAYMRERLAYIEEINAAIATIDTEPSYDAESVFAWMKTWGTPASVPASEFIKNYQPPHED